MTPTAGQELTPEQKKAQDDAAAAAAAVNGGNGVGADDLSKKLSDAEQEKNAALARAASAEFDRDLMALTQKYPNLKEIPADQLKEAVQKGTPLEDAAVVMLHKAGKLHVPAPTPAPSPAPAPAPAPYGGSAPNGNLVPPGKKDPKTMTTDELLDELRKAEANGEILLTN